MKKINSSVPYHKEKIIPRKENLRGSFEVISYIQFKQNLISTSQLFLLWAHNLPMLQEVVTDHKFNMETLIVHEICHECLEALGLWTHILEVVKGIEDDLMASLYKADCSQELQY